MTEQEGQKAVTDRTRPGNLLYFPSGKFLGLFFLDLDMPKLIIFTGLQRRISPIYIFLCGDVIFLCLFSARVLNYKPTIIRCGETICF